MCNTKPKQQTISTSRDEYIKQLIDTNVAKIVVDQQTVVNPVQTDIDFQAKFVNLSLTCIDYRFIDYVILNNKLTGFSDTDFQVYAGSSGGVNNGSLEPSCVNYWRKTFFDQLALARLLHDVKQVRIFDHEDCGYYKAIYPGVEYPQMFEKHIENLLLLKNDIHTVYPDMIIQLFILLKNGDLIEIN